MGVVIDPAACNACRTCDLACSFHHRRVFAPEGSSVKVVSDAREGKIQVSIDATCDLCPEEPRPMCVQYCLAGALKKGGAHELTDSMPVSVGKTTILPEDTWRSRSGLAPAPGPGAKEKNGMKCWTGSTS